VGDPRGRSDRTIFRDDSGEVPWLYDWSHDGSQILVKLVSEDGARRIALIDINTGNERIVQEITQGDPSLVSLSMDGRYVAYDLPDDVPPQHQSIRIVDTANGGEHILLPGEQSNNRFPLWTGDGRSLFFLSDRSGTPDGWIVPVLEDDAIGEPRIAARNLGAVSLLGLTDTGTLYYDFQSGQFDIYEAELDPQTMTLSGQPQVIRSRRQGSNIGPSYSHDGRHLAYISQRTALGGNLAARVIVVRDLTTGAERDVATPLELGVVSPIWSPDDRRLLVRGTNRRNRWGEFVVDATTGAIQSEIVWPQTVRNEGRRSIWNHDGTAILFSDQARGIVEHPLDGGPERVEFSKDRMPSGPGMNMFAYTNDSNRLAFTSWNQQIALDVVDSNGVVRELVRAEPRRTLNFQAWFPGGDYLLYSVSSPGRRGPDELWRVAVSGGVPQRVGLPINALTSVNTVALNPAGTAVAYTSGFVEYGLWIMDNFLPR
jgi:Tol biopolymer transport system component